jgi:hypothetical protein
LLIESCEKRRGERLALAGRRGRPLSATANAIRAAAREVVEAPGARDARSSTRAVRLIPFGAALGALAIQLIRPTNPDVSWLLTVNERILAGAVPYKDVVELNPPASILLYRIPVLVAKLLSARPEWVVAGMLALLIGGALAYAGKLLARYRLGAAADNGLFLAVAGLVLAVLPFDEMAQREHFATIFMFPFALAAIARATGEKIALADCLVAGAALGLCVAIKPYFALCPLLVAGFQAWRSRDFRALLRIEYWAAGAVALAYFIASVIFYPRFFSDILPMLADLYLPLRLDALVLLPRIVLLVALPVALCWIWRDRQRNAGAAVLLLIGAGFVGAYLMQGKGWTYHSYPAIAFSLLAAGWAAQQAESRTTGLQRRLGAGLLAAALILPAPRFFRADSTNPALAAAITRLAAHRKILAIAFPLNVGHPLTRDIGGVWVGHTWGLWATGGALFMKAHAGDDPVRRAKADAYLEGDRQMTAQDIETQRPDIVLIQQTAGFDFAQWIAQSAPLRAAMARYKRVETVDGVEIYQRQDDAAEASDPAARPITGP